MGEILEFWARRQVCGSGLRVHEEHQSSRRRSDRLASGSIGIPVVQVWIDLVHYSPVFVSFPLSYKNGMYLRLLHQLLQ